MYGQIDRLSDEWWTENELAQMHKAVINPSRYDKTPKHICWYHLLKEGEYTGKAMLLAVVEDARRGNPWKDVESHFCTNAQHHRFVCAG